MTKQIRDYNMADFPSINEALSLFFPFYADGFQNRTVEENWHLFKTKISELIDAFVPLVHIHSNSNRFNKSLKILSRKKKRLFRLAKRSNVPEAWANYKNCEIEFDSTITLAKEKYYGSHLPSLLTNNPKKFWK
ncbi:unnamed protein product [Ixodes persulcatus]